MSFLADFEHFIRSDEPLAPYTWLRLGGPAQYFAEPTNLDELVAVVARARDEALPVRLLGGGSGVLVRDEGVPGVVIRLAAPAFGEVQVEKQMVKAGGGAVLGHVISAAVRDGLAGMEQLVGIPGTVGGALKDNASTHGGDIGQFANSVTVLTLGGELITHRRDDLHFAHRQSSLNELAIVSAEFELEQDDPRDIARRMQTLWISKRSRQPMGQQNTARLFRSPRGMSASEAIEQANLKGRTRVGGAEISSDHANFVIAHSECTSSDVLKLIELIQQQVQDRVGIELESEIAIW